jgi:hypothetical protein
MVTRFSVPFTKKKEVSQAWKEYLPPHLDIAGVKHAILHTQSSPEESWVTALSYKVVSTEIQGSLVPFPLALAALTKLFKTDCLALCYTDTKTVYVLQIEQGFIKAYTHAPHLLDVDLQCEAVIKSLALATTLPFFTFGHLQSQVEKAFTKRGFLKASLKNEQLCTDPCFNPIALGLAIHSESLLKTTSSVSLFPKPLRALCRLNKWPLTVFWTLALACSLSFFLCGHITSEKNKSLARSKFKELQSVSPVPHTVPFPDTPQAFRYQVQRASYATKTKPLPYNMFPSLPKLYYILDWLDSHSPSAITIDGLSYDLIEKPSKRSPTSPYVAKLSLEITCADVESIQAFRKTLFEDALFLDQTKPCSWNTKLQKHTATFFLKADQGKP